MIMFNVYMTICGCGHHYVTHVQCIQISILSPVLYSIISYPCPRLGGISQIKIVLHSHICLVLCCQTHYTSRVQQFGVLYAL